jgi:hypothetical protein
MNKYVKIISILIVIIMRIILKILIINMKMNIKRNSLWDKMIALLINCYIAIHLKVCYRKAN